MPLSGIDLSKATVPLLLVVSLLGAVAIGGVYIGQAIEINTVTRTQLDRLSETVSSLDNALRKVETTIASFAPKSQWKREDQTKFCLEAERSNPGWKCPKFE